MGLLHPDVKKDSNSYVERFYYGIITYLEKTKQGISKKEITEEILKTIEYTYLKEDVMWWITYLLRKIEEQ